MNLIITSSKQLRSVQNMLLFYILVNPTKISFRESVTFSLSRSRYLLQLHNDDGSIFGGAHGGGAQLPPQDGRNT